MLKKILPWAVTVTAVLAVALVVAPRNPAHGHVHPAPRVDTDGVLTMSVMEPTTASNYQRAVRAYRIAEVIPEVLDGLHCYCECHENIGHRSLLTCFNDRHGAACDVCIGEAEMAASMTQQGDDVETIRTAIDANFGPGSL